MSDAVIHKIDQGGVCVIGHGQRVVLEFWLDSRRPGEDPLRIEMSPGEVLGLIGLAAPAAKAAMLAGLK